MLAKDREQRAADKEQRSERVERDCPDESVALQSRVTGWTHVRSRRQRALRDRGERDRDDRGDQPDGQRAEQKVARPPLQQQPRRAGAEQGHRQDTTGDVVRLEKRFRPAGSLRRGLARGRDGEAREAAGPECFLAGRTPQERRGEQAGEEQGDERRAERQ